MDRSTVDVIVIDIDGTLMDSSYHHALAWSRAFRSVGTPVDVWRIHRAIGMGGDQLVPAVAGEDFDRRSGDQVREAWIREYEPFLREVRPFEGANRFLQRLNVRGVAAVLASSSPADHVNHYLDLLGARGLVDDWTTADDVERSKPEPDLVAVAMKKVDAHTALMVGDSPWDAVAASRAGIGTWGVLTGGFAEEELRRAGVLEVHDSITALGDDLLGAPARG